MDLITCNAWVKVIQSCREEVQWIMKCCKPKGEKWGIRDEMLKGWGKQPKVNPNPGIFHKQKANSEEDRGLMGCKGKGWVGRSNYSKNTKRKITL